MGGISDWTLEKREVLTAPANPVINPWIESVQGEVINLSVATTDADGDVLTYAANSLPTGLSINPQTGLISGTITANYGGTFASSVEVSDGESTSWSGTYWMIINRAPDVSSINMQTNAEGEAISFAVLASDPDNDDLTYSATALPPGLAIDTNTGIITGTIAYDAVVSPYNNLIYEVTVTASDGDLQDSASFWWTVLDTNRAPEFAESADQTSAEGDVIELAILGSDPDGDSLTFAATGLPAGLSINPTTGVIAGTVEYSAAETNGGTYGVTVNVWDGLLTTSTAFSWTVTNTNRAPVLESIVAQTNAEGDVIELAVLGSDPDGDALTFTTNDLPAGLSINSTTGVITGTVEHSAAETNGGIYNVSVTVWDGLLTTSAAFSWTVTNTNRAPKASHDIFVMMANDIELTGIVLNNDNDVDGDALQVVDVNGITESVGVDLSLASGALLHINADGGFVYTPAGPCIAKDTFTYTLSDGVESTTANVTILPGPALVQVSSIDFVMEAEAGPTPVHFFVTRKGGDQAQALTVRYRVKVLDESTGEEIISSGSLSLSAIQTTTIPAQADDTEIEIQVPQPTDPDEYPAGRRVVIEILEQDADAIANGALAYFPAALPLAIASSVVSSTFTLTDADKALIKESIKDFDKAKVESAKLTDGFKGKVIAASGEAVTLSGWLSGHLTISQVNVTDMVAFNKLIYNVSKDTELPLDPTLDNKISGAFYSTHAEKQLIYRLRDAAEIRHLAVSKSGNPIAMCEKCLVFFKKYAKHSGKTVAVCTGETVEFFDTQGIGHSILIEDAKKISAQSP